MFGDFWIICQLLKLCKMSKRPEYGSLTVLLDHIFGAKISSSHTVLLLLRSLSQGMHFLDGPKSPEVFGFAHAHHYILRLSFSMTSNSSDAFEPS